MGWVLLGILMRDWWWFRDWIWVQVLWFWGLNWGRWLIEGLKIFIWMKLINSNLNIYNLKFFFSIWLKNHIKRKIFGKIYKKTKTNEINMKSSRNIVWNIFISIVIFCYLIEIQINYRIFLGIAGIFGF